MIKNIQEAYHPSLELSIDESFIGFKGRLSFNQYLPKKPSKKYGFIIVTLSFRKG